MLFLLSQRRKGSKKQLYPREQIRCPHTLFHHNVLCSSEKSVSPCNQTSETIYLCLFFRLGLSQGLYSTANLPPHLYHNIYNRVTPCSISPTNILVAVRMVMYKCYATTGLEEQPKNNAAPRMSKKGHGRIC